MENDNSWHYTRLNEENYQQAVSLINDSKA